MNDRESPAFQELYTFLVACFVRADSDMEGTVSQSVANLIKPLHW